LAAGKKKKNVSSGLSVADVLFATKELLSEKRHDDSTNPYTNHNFSPDDSVKTADHGLRRRLATISGGI
jgi:hypothetical protein